MLELALSITRIYNHSVKHLKSGAARVYIQNSEALTSSNFKAHTKFEITYKKNVILIVEDPNGSNMIMKTKRGLLLELKNKDTEKSLSDLQKVSVTFNKGMITISIRYIDRLKIERETSLKKKVKNGDKLKSGSLFSGLGLLSNNIRIGLDSGGINSEIVFANDSCPIAMECNLRSSLWDDAPDESVAICAALESIDLTLIPNCDLVEIGIPCINFSRLCKKEHRDINHPIVGALFTSLLPIIEKANPSLLIFECTPDFINSITLDLIKRSLNGYRIEHRILNAYEFGHLEKRERACVVAISDGLPELNIKDIVSEKQISREVLSDHLEPISIESELWREYGHVKSKENDRRLNFKNTIYKGSEDCIATITATYSAPKVGTPFIAHPTNPELMRQLTVLEHANIRGGITDTLLECILLIENGNFPFCTGRGNKKKAHHLLGNTVSPKPWQALGKHIAQTLISAFSDNNSNRIVKAA